MPANDKTGTEEENFSLHFVQNVARDGGKKSETFQKTNAECSNGSETSEEEHPFIEFSEE